MHGVGRVEHASSPKNCMHGPPLQLKHAFGQPLFRIWRKMWGSPNAYPCPRCMPLRISRTLAPTCLTRGSWTLEHARIALCISPMFSYQSATQVNRSVYAVFAPLASLILPKYVSILYETPSSTCQCRPLLGNDRLYPSKQPPSPPWAASTRGEATVKTWSGECAGHERLAQASTPPGGRARGTRPPLPKWTCRP